MLTANFEKGANGAPIAVGGDGDADAWDNVVVPAGGTVVYDNTRAAQGGQSAKLATGATAGSVTLVWLNTKFGTLADHYARFYIYATAFPATQYAVSQTSFGVTTAATIQITTTGKVALRDSANAGASSATSIALNQWVRIEFHVAHNASAGVIDGRLFNTPGATVPTETWATTGRNTLANGDRIRFGQSTGLANFGPIWLDGIVAAASGWVGPDVVPSRAPQLMLVGVGV